MYVCTEKRAQKHLKRNSMSTKMNKRPTVKTNILSDKTCLWTGIKQMLMLLRALPEKHLLGTS